MVIVPQLPEHPTPEEQAAWKNSEPKEYKTRILLETDSKRMNDFIRLGFEDRWKDLDGRKLEFRNDFRPDTRYLFFYYCVRMTRLAWTRRGQDTDVRVPLKMENYWGIKGGYLPRNMLRALVNELGNEYEHLMDGALEEEEEKEEEQKKEEDESNGDILLAAIMMKIRLEIDDEEHYDYRDDLEEDQEREDSDDDHDLEYKYMMEDFERFYPW